MKWWKETRRRGEWGENNQKVKDGDNAAAEKGSETTKFTKRAKKKASGELLELSGAIVKKDEEDRGELIKQDNQ